MMKVFEDVERTRTLPKKPGEGDFDFYNSSARKPFIKYRELVNSWLSELPTEEQAEMVVRLRTGTNVQYEAALTELVIHAALRRLGWTVEIHPACPHPTRRPDFLVKDARGNSLAFVEVTTFGPEVKMIKVANREAAIYNALNSVDLPPGWLLGYFIDQYGADSPSLRKLKRDVELWAVEVCGDNPALMPRRVFEAGEWRIELTLHGGFRTDNKHERKIAAALTDVRSLAPHLDLRQALELKGQRYGIVETPYLIVVADCKDSIPSGDDVPNTLIEALFGSPEVIIRTFPDGRSEAFERRGNDGYWGRPGDPRNINVSGVLLIPQPNIWKLRDQRWQPLLAVNPFAANPLPDKLLPLPGVGYREKMDEFIFNEGILLADILELDEEWPPVE